MIPLRDENPSHSTPVVNWVLIAACVLVFLLQMRDESSSLVMKFGMVPVRISHPDAVIVRRGEEVVQTPFGPQVVKVEQELPRAAIPEILTMLSCIFLHGSLMHLLGNIWFLYIFGDNVEDRFGHVSYLCFYLGCGVAASLVQFLFMRDSSIPTIGASGAIAGVMGAYLFLYPRARIVSLIPIAIFLQVVVIPAPIFLGIWFLFNLLQGTFALGSMEAAGVAWWAHIGGFVAGILVAVLFGRRPSSSGPRVVVVDRWD